MLFILKSYNIKSQLTDSLWLSTEKMTLLICTLNQDFSTLQYYLLMLLISECTVFYLFLQPLLELNLKQK